LYPDVKIIKGRVDLFWCGGMRCGWNSWVSKQSYDAVLVFNDDIVLYPEAINRLIRSAQLIGDYAEPFVIVGSLKEGRSDLISYGGMKKINILHPTRFSLVEPSNINLGCDTINMNFTLISSGSINLIGFLSKDYIHHRADFDYGLRLKSAGGKVIVAEGCYGECDREADLRDNIVYDMSLFEGWKKLISIKYAAPRERAVFLKLHGGLLWPLFWAIPYVMFLFRWGIRKFSIRFFHSKI
jgi:GT2 family glycosyltransferase